MSIETDFRALLAGHAPLVALVGTRIALNAVPEGMSAPLVVYAVKHGFIDSLGPRLGDQATVEAQAWGLTALQAAQVADAIQAAISAAPSDPAVTVLGRETTFDPDIGMDGELLSVEWWT